MVVGSVRPGKRRESGLRIGICDDVAIDIDLVHAPGEASFGCGPTVNEPLRPHRTAPRSSSARQHPVQRPLALPHTGRTSCSTTYAALSPGWPAKAAPLLTSYCPPVEWHPDREGGIQGLDLVRIPVVQCVCPSGHINCRGRSSRLTVVGRPDQSLLLICPASELPGLRRGRLRLIDDRQRARTRSGCRRRSGSAIRPVIPAPIPLGGGTTEEHLDWSLSPCSPEGSPPWSLCSARESCPGRSAAVGFTSSDPHPGCRSGPRGAALTVATRSGWKAIW